LLSELLRRNLYWSDSTIASLVEFGSVGRKAWEAVIAKGDGESYAAYFRSMRTETRKLEDTIRVQGQLHLGDRKPSMKMVLDMAERAVNLS
jgi:hypothetical protein